MEIILLESFDRLGKIGDTVNVKDGFARNFLLPQKKALRANKANKEYFEKIKQSLEEKNNELVQGAEKLSEKLISKEIVFIRQASETGQLYGSVSPKDISNYFKKDGIIISPSSINLSSAIKKTGIYNIKIKLHADVSFITSLNVAVSEDSAMKQKKIKESKKLDSSEDKKIENNEATSSDELKDNIKTDFVDDEKSGSLSDDSKEEEKPSDVKDIEK